MSDHDSGRGHPPREHQESAYPPPPGEEDDRPRPYHQLPPPPAAVTLPPIQDPHPPYGGSRYPPPSDARSRGNYSASPTGVPNGFPPPPGGMYNLPPVQAPLEQRHGLDPREYYPRGGSYPPPPPPEHYNYGSAYRPSGSPYGAYPADYSRVPGGPAQQAAPRQRTSIACRYCRKRKIRCSGYSQTPDGKCTNCRKTGNECIFQPVSSSSTTAFVPVSAVPGGVPPGTPLFGAFGQPLPQGAGAGGQPGAAPQPPPTGGSQQPYPSSDNYALPSPTGSYYPQPPDDRAEAGRRRPHEDDHGQRLPPPHVYGEADPRRRSPASSAHGGTPPQAQYEYANYDPADRTGTPRRDSPNAPQPGPGGPMSLSSLMDNPPLRPPASSDSSRDIDRNMLGRLNRRT